MSSATVYEVVKLLTVTSQSLFQAEPPRRLNEAVLHAPSVLYRFLVCYKASKVGERVNILLGAL